jgi:hypothetical protein
MKTIYYSCLAVLLSIAFSSFSQDTKFQTVYESEKVIVSSANYLYSPTGQGINHDRIIFEYTNKSTEPITLVLSFDLDYGSTSSSGSENSYELVLAPKETKRFNTDENLTKPFYIFHNDRDGFIKAVLLSFNLTVKEII